MKSVLITGANRGIGLKFVEHYCQNNWQVYATYREEHQDLLALTTEYDNLTLLRLDVSSQDSINKLAHSMTGISLNLLINNAGIYGPSGFAFGGMEDKADGWREVLNINTIGPHLVTEALIKNLQFGAPSKIAYISSKMGSMTDNTSGGAYIYRSSKAALNAVIKSLSFDLSDMNIAVLSLHPGWVQTRMGGDNALIDTETSVNGMTKVIENLSIENTGRFVAYDGKVIPW